MPDTSHWIILTALIAVLVAALAVNHYVHQRHQTAENRRLHSKRLKAHIHQLLDTLTVLKQTPCNPQLVRLLGDYSIDLFKQLASLSEDAQMLNQLENTAATTAPLSLQLKSDKDLQRAQFNIAKGSAFLMNLKQQGKLTPQIFNEYRQELQWIHCLVAADAHIQQGKRMLEAGRPSSASSHFKHARAAISKHQSSDPRSGEKLTEIRQLLEQSKPQARVSEALDGPPLG